MDEREVEFLEVKNGAVSIKNERRGVAWAFGGVCGPILEGSKMVFLEEMMNIMVAWISHGC